MQRGTEAASLAAQFGITPKAVRDIWNLRTWTKTTMPFWTQADLNKRLCKQCRSRKIRSLPDACETCSKPRSRGRPRIQRIKLWPDTAAKATEKDVLQVSTVFLGSIAFSSLDSLVSLDTGLSREEFKVVFKN